MAAACALAFPAIVHAASPTETPGETGAPAPPAEYPTPPVEFSPLVEAENYSITQQRQQVYDTPEYQALLTEQSLLNTTEATTEAALDPERLFNTDLCWNAQRLCRGRAPGQLERDGYGTVRHVLYTARDGATISGRVWRTIAGPRKRPGIVITDGSVQADEQLYWYAAETLAKDGYVVFTFDPQGQGRSDTLGHSPGRGRGRPCADRWAPLLRRTEDALDFFLSTPQHPYEPVPSCETGTSHAQKQNERAAKGLDAAYNPYSALDPSEIGLAVTRMAPLGVSYVGQCTRA